MKIIYLAVLAFLLLASETVSGVPANPEPFNLTQPDNSSFQARQVGDERAAHFETLEGYTIVQDETKWWSYAKKDEKGKIISTGKKVGLVKPEKLDLPKHTHQSITEDIFLKEPVVSVLAAQVGTKKSIVILINFTDVNQNADHTPAYYENLLFNTSANANSVHNYYKEVSFNQINITGNIAGNRWHGSVHNQSFYGKDLDHQNKSHDNYYGNSFSLAREALILADSDINFATYDTNSDGVLNRDEINIMIVHAGCGEENESCSGWSTDSIWSHKGSILGSPYGCSDCIDTFLDGKRISRNNSNEDVAGYTMQSEFSPIGTFAHEYGHNLGLPDLYDTDYTSYGVGKWDIMGSGMWLNNGNTPSHLSAWSKYLLGWVNPTKVTSTLLNEQINQSETNDDVYMLLDNPGDSPGNLDWTSSGTGTGEYFLVENRRQIGYDANLPGEGLLIWHIDESRGNNTNENHKLVDLEEADGLNHLDYNNTNNSGDPNDPWYSSVTGFTNTFNPNSKLYNGSASNVSVTNISASGYTMTANLNVASSDWQYNRKLTITGTTADVQTNYQMKLTVYKGNGTDTPGVVYLGGNVKDDFSDLRFTKSDGVTLLDYWVESYTSGVSATVWVEVDSIPASPNTVDIYLYYGNPSAASSSNGANTFAFFEDGESHANNAQLSSGGWYDVGTGGKQNYTSDRPHTGTMDLKLYEAVPIWGNMAAHGATYPAGWVLSGYVYDSLDNSLNDYGTFGVVNSNIGWEKNTNGDKYRYIFPGESRTSTTITRSGGWHRFEYRYTPTTLSLYIDSQQVKSGSYTAAYTDIRIGQFWNTGVWFDDIILRRYSSPEPTWN